MEIGYRYRSPAILTEGGDDGALPSIRATRPGARAAGPRTSSLARDGERDVDPGPVRAALRPARRAPGRGVAPRGREAAAATGCRSTSTSAGGAGAGADAEDPAGASRRPTAWQRDGAALVRPDGFVAWRSVAAVDEPAEALERVLRSTLGVRSRAASAA